MTAIAPSVMRRVGCHEMVEGVAVKTQAGNRHTRFAEHLERRLGIFEFELRAILLEHEAFGHVGEGDAIDVQSPRVQPAFDRQQLVALRVPLLCYPR